MVPIDIAWIILFVEPSRAVVLFLFFFLISWSLEPTLLERFLLCSLFQASLKRLVCYGRQMSVSFFLCHTAAGSRRSQGNIIPWQVSSVQHERCNDFLTVTSLVSQKLSHPWLRGTERPDGKTLSTFLSYCILEFSYYHLLSYKNDKW